jgi:CheY-like chemotaxis protein
LARKILLADDSVTAQNMGRKILADAGYEVLTVNNGSAALKKIAEHKPDLIVLDVYMPGYSGLEVCQRLKEARETARIPVLLTVGKLEPFKPEEAKRARADAFIVKPFEASELLSALAKMEERIVPRAEPSKPGRFARAIAAVEEGPTAEDASGDQDTGWKSRIAFPSKKKPKVEEEVEDTTSYNSVNRDMPARLEPEKPQEKSADLHAHAPASAGENHVDVTAVASMGLPKDVTPEEIAALAAAVAQVQAKVSAAHSASRPAENSSTSAADTQPVKLEESKEAASASEKIESKIDSTAATAAQAAEQRVADWKAADQKIVDQKIEDAKSEAKIETKSEAVAEVKEAEVKEPEQAANHADLIAAIASLEPANGMSWDTHRTSPGSGPRSAEDDAPVTMAVATGASQGSRWSAVPVALEPNEVSISLEHEMQKAYAAFAAAEANLPGFISSTSGSAAPAQTNSAVAVAEAVAPPSPEISPVAEAAPAVAPAPESEPVPDSAAVVEHSAAASSDTPPAAASEPPAVTEAVQPESHAEEIHAAPASSSQDAPRVSAFQNVTSTVYENFLASTSRDESKSGEAIPESEPAPAQESASSEAKSEAEATPGAETRSETDAKPETKLEASETKIEQTSEAKEDAAPAAEPVIVAAAPEASADSAKLPEAEPVAEQAPAAPELAVPRSTSSGGAASMSDRESAAAAAWASWRQIRESGDNGKSSPSSRAAANDDDDDEDDVPTATSLPAAMAVAAGAEKRPEEAAEAAAGPDPNAIASIVDSVLADLRPKIVAEISKKLGEKK